MDYNEYMSDYMAKRYQRRKTEALAQLGGECIECGATENLEFDHIDPSTKEFCIAGKLAGVSQERLDLELAKCQLLCGECHKKKSRQNGDYQGGTNKILNPQHGTWAMYTNEKCKCEKCKEWRRLYRKKLVDARGNPCV